MQEQQRSNWPVVLTAEDAISILRIGRTAFYEAIRLNRIPHFRIGKHIRVSRDALFTWMENGGLEQVTTR